jgi:hypothetical protein
LLTDFVPDRDQLMSDPAVPALKVPTRLHAVEPAADLLAELAAHVGKILLELPNRLTLSHRPPAILAVTGSWAT